MRGVQAAWWVLGVLWLGVACCGCGGAPPVLPRQAPEPVREEVFVYLEPCGDDGACRVTDLVVTADGQRVLVASRSAGEAHAVVYDSALATALAPALRADAASLSPDGRWLCGVLAEPAGVLAVVDLYDPAGAPALLAQDGLRAVFSPDSARLAVATHGGAELTELDLGTGDRVAWGPLSTGSVPIGWGPAGVIVASPRTLGVVRRPGESVLVRLEFEGEPEWLAVTPGYDEVLYRQRGFAWILVEGEPTEAEQLVGLVYPAGSGRRIQTPDPLPTTRRALSLVRLADGDLAQLSVDGDGRRIIANRLVTRR